MITIQFNDKQFNCDDNLFLNDFLIKLNFDNSYCAIAVNKKFIPKAHYNTTLLQSGDQVEAISPMQGG